MDEERDVLNTLQRGEPLPRWWNACHSLQFGVWAQRGEWPSTRASAAGTRAGLRDRGLRGVRWGRRSGLFSPFSGSTSAADQGQLEA